MCLSFELCDAIAGGTLLRENLQACTSVVTARSNTRFAQWLSFDLPLASVPRDARVCFTVSSYEDGAKVRRTVQGCAGTLKAVHSNTVHAAKVRRRGVCVGGFCSYSP